MRVVQVPMEEVEIRELSSCARKLKISRAELIRKACRNFLQTRETARLEEAYARGYQEVPEETALAEVSAILLGGRLLKEDWA